MKAKVKDWNRTARSQELIKECKNWIIYDQLGFKSYKRLQNWKMGALTRA